MILDILEIVAPVFLCAGVGYGWRRAKQPYDTALVTRLVSLVGAPCLIFSTLAGIESMADDILGMIVAALVAVAGFAVLSALALKLLGLPLRSFLAALVFPNAGNMGLPLCLFAFGDEGLALGIGYFAVTATLNLTLGNWFYSGATTPWRALKTPIPYAVALGLVLMATGTEPPDFILKTTRLLGGFAIPLMMLSLGVSLADLGITKPARTLLLALLRFGTGLGVGYAVAVGFGFEGAQKGVVIIQSAMPVAVFNYLFAAFYKRNPEEIASLVLISSALGFLSLPLLVYLAR
ncbi:MAG: AEC family transporter [Alphaproteobacteria bacterium]